MTVATTVAANVASRARLPKSATIGALVFLAGAALVYWSLYRSRDGKGLFGLGAAATTGDSLLEQAAQGAGITKRSLGPLDAKDAATGGSGARRAGGAGGQEVR